MRSSLQRLLRIRAASAPAVTAPRTACPPSTASENTAHTPSARASAPPSPRRPAAHASAAAAAHRAPADGVAHPTRLFLDKGGRVLAVQSARPPLSPVWIARRALASGAASGAAAGALAALFLPALAALAASASAAVVGAGAGAAVARAIARRATPDPLAAPLGGDAGRARVSLVRDGREVRLVRFGSGGEQRRWVRHGVFLGVIGRLRRCMLSRAAAVVDEVRLVGAPAAGLSSTSSAAAAPGGPTILKKIPVSVSEVNELVSGEYVFVDNLEHLERHAEEDAFVYFTHQRRSGKTTYLHFLAAYHSASPNLKKASEEGRIKTKFVKFPERPRPVIKLVFAFSVTAGNVSNDCNENVKSALISQAETLFDDRVEKAREAAQDATSDHLVKEAEREKAAVLSKVQSARHARRALIELVRGLNPNRDPSLAPVLLVDELDYPMLRLISWKASTVDREAFTEFLSDFFSPTKGDFELLLHSSFLTGCTLVPLKGSSDGMSRYKILTFKLGEAGIPAPQLGFTRRQVEESFAAHIAITASKLKMTESALMDELVAWYDGYLPDPESAERRLNQWSVLQFFHDQMFRSYWADVGTSSPLLGAVTAETARKVLDAFERGEDVEVPKHVLTTRQSVELAKFHEQVAFMTQHGDLAVRPLADPTKPSAWHVGVPNREIGDFVLPELLNLLDSTLAAAITTEARDMLIAGDMAKLMHHFASNVLPKSHVDSSTSSAGPKEWSERAVHALLATFLSRLVCLRFRRDLNPQGGIVFEPRLQMTGRAESTPSPDSPKPSRKGNHGFPDIFFVIEPKTGAKVCYVLELRRAERAISGAARTKASKQVQRYTDALRALPETKDARISPWVVVFGPDGKLLQCVAPEPVREGGA